MTEDFENSQEIIYQVFLRKRINGRVLSITSITGYGMDPIVDKTPNAPKVFFRARSFPFGHYKGNGGEYYEYGKSVND